MAQVPAGKNRSGQLSKQTGDAWENQARRWLEGQGLRFIAANARERGGEIDLIMRDGTVTVFIEVRYRRSARYGDAAASVTPQKQQRNTRSKGSRARQNQSLLYRKHSNPNCRSGSTPGRHLPGGDDARPVPA